MGQRPLQVLPLEVENRVLPAAREDEPIVLDRSVRLFLVARMAFAVEISVVVALPFAHGNAKVIGSAVVVRADLCKIGDGPN